jgi:hypothetical protein
MNVNGEHNKNAITKLPTPACNDRLDSWKQIAVYLGREIRTVQRWERLERLPVRRHFHVKGGTVYAFKNEIDAWLTSRRQIPGESRAIRKRSRQVVKGSNPPPHVMRHMLSAFRLWLDFEVRESCQDQGDMAVPDLRMVPDDPQALFLLKD